MTRDEVTALARKAGFVGFDGDNGSLRRFAALVAAHEREACAKVCYVKGYEINAMGNQNMTPAEVVKACAEAIMAQ